MLHVEQDPRLEGKSILDPMPNPYPLFIAYDKEDKRYRIAKTIILHVQAI